MMIKIQKKDRILSINCNCGVAKGSIVYDLSLLIKLWHVLLNKFWVDPISLQETTGLEP